MDNKKFGNFIKELRKEKNLTQKELGEKINITDKAISKWERGISFPDIVVLKDLADFFNVDVSELLNGKRGTKQEIDIEKAIQEAIEGYKNAEEKRKEKIQKIKNKIGIASVVIFILFLILQISYIIIFKRHNYEYVADSMEYIINQLLILSAAISMTFLLKKKKLNKMIYILAIIFTVVNISFMFNNGFKRKSIVSFSKSFSNELVLKIDKSTGTIKIYRNPKLLIFAKESEQFEYESTGKIKKQWLESDICEITYQDKNNKLREYVATYGDRSDGASYYNVATALLGDWQVFTKNGQATQISVDNKEMIVTKNGKKEHFEYAQCKQYGTIALVLYKNNTPKYVIGLNKNCQIDSKTGIIKKDGTITLTEVSIDKTKVESLYCMTYKDLNDLSNYNTVYVEKNNFKIKNGIMYVSLDGKNVIEVPGDFSDMIDSYNGNDYQISEEKI